MPRGRGRRIEVDVSAATATVLVAGVAGVVLEPSEVNLIMDGANEITLDDGTDGVFGPFEASAAFALAELSGERCAVGAPLRLVTGQANKVTGHIWVREYNVGT